MALGSFEVSNNRAFSPRDYQIELLSEAIEDNIIVCLSSKIAKEFCALKLIQELSHDLRRSKNRKISLYLTSSISAFNLIRHLTDLKVINLNIYDDDEEIEWEKFQDDYQVLILETKQCLQALEASVLDLNRVNLIIVDDCHQRTRKTDISDIFLNYYNKAKHKPKVLGLAGPIHSAACNPGRLGAELEYLENLMNVRTETASDIVTVLRYSPKPIEIIAECGVPSESEVIAYIRNLVNNQRKYIQDHRYDPSEIYADDEFKEELENIPDPKEEPLRCFDEFLAILNDLGVYCADKAALQLISQIEKLKIKTPYERHYLLLCLVSTTLIQVRSFCDIIFKTYENEKDKIEAFSSPKVFRLLEVLKLFKPSSSVSNLATNHHSKKRSKIESNNEIIKDISLEEMNTLVSATTNLIDKIGEDLENLKASVKKIENGEDLSNTPTIIATKTTTTTSSKAINRYNRFKNRRRYFHHRPRHHNQAQGELDSLCGLIFCDSTITAKTLFALLCEISRNDPDLKFLNVQYTIEKTANPITDLKEAENEHRKQEEVLKKFRTHECNILISTAILEEGFDLPKCNLVVRFDQPASYRSYVQCKGRSRAQNALHVLMVSPKCQNNSFQNDEIENLKNHRYICNLTTKTVNDDDDDDEDEEEKLENEKVPFVCAASEVDEEENKTIYQSVEECSNVLINQLSEYMEIEKMLIRNCQNKEPGIWEVAHADLFTRFIRTYQPSNTTEGAQVNLSNAIALINKYCAKLPSDTFTKLTPLWRCCKTIRNGQTLFQYTLRLPLNSPVKHDIFGVPMPTRTLARRTVAFVGCIILHKSGELDDNLQPIGKEGFKAIEEDWQFFELDKVDEELNGNDPNDPRPGTTKRRQYYYKKIAAAFTNCRPTTETKAFLYHIKMTLQCPIPEEQNTRGRKIYPPEEAVQSFGILMTKRIPKISAFPIFTRSGEVKVSLQLIKKEVTLDSEQLEKINTFINYTFTNVLRLRKYLMLFDAEAMENNFFIVPVLRDFRDENLVEIDWNFLSVINNNANTIPQFVSDEERKDQTFDHVRFKDSVVMPWYRNQDQPQYFYVAEICSHLTPESSFPGEHYKTFREYYFKKYGIEIQNRNQPLLDVDHTSARLNFLTPRYVNRKGVALPTSSEETKRAKRENLEQKQILVPELCTIHPFTASLWRAAVCLPCILYRINALLLADEIRKEVSKDLGLGTMEVVKLSEDEKFEWPMLDFGWTLADVLKKTREAKIISKENQRESNVEDDTKNMNGEKEKSANDLLEEADQKAKGEHILQIGMWSNEMAKDIKDDYDEDDEEMGVLPRNLQLCSTRNIRYGSPTSWEVDIDGMAGKNGTVKTNLQDGGFYPYESDEDDDDDDDFQSDGDDYEGGLNDSNEDEYGLKIEFKNDHLAEAFESEAELLRRQRKIDLLNTAMANEKSQELAKNQPSGFNFIEESQLIDLDENIKMHEKNFEESTLELKKIIKSNGILVTENDKIPSNIRQSLMKSEPGVNSDEIISVTSLVPYIESTKILDVVNSTADQTLQIEDLFAFNQMYQQEHREEMFEVIGSGDLFDHFSDREHMHINLKNGNCEKTIKLVIKNDFEKIILKRNRDDEKGQRRLEKIENSSFGEKKSSFSFDYQPDLNNHPGPSPSILLQALTMSNANDGINLERLETIGDSFLKYAITTYLYCTYENVNEGKLSYLRSKQVSNLNLYRLGRKKILGESMIATKFEPQDNWLPPCYFVPKELEQALIDAKIPVCYWNLADLPDIKSLSSNEICTLVKERAAKLRNEENLDNDGELQEKSATQILPLSTSEPKQDNLPCFIPYNLVTQHSIPDKSIADCVEALIGAYLIDCGARGALLFMAWLGIRVLPILKINEINNRVPGSTKAFEEGVGGGKKQIVYGYWNSPKTPLLRCIPDADETLELLLNGFETFEEELNYKFKDRSYLLQAMTHASYTVNRLTDCYQRLEFLGDAVLDYLITRHLYEDPRLHSPGALTDLRSALVNNTIFASLAVRHDFHKYFRHLSPPLNEVIDRFVQIQHENGHSISEEYYLLSEDECNESEDVEVPKALGDIFESVAGAIFLDSNMSLDAVWGVYYRMMGPEIEQFSRSVPKSPIRELLELEPETAKFGRPEKLADGRRVRVTVEVFGKGIFRGIGRNYRIAKCTAAKCALRHLKKNNVVSKKQNH